MGLDTAFSAVGNKHRLRLLVALLEHKPHEEVQLPEGVPASETAVEQVETELYHLHLPKLEDAGYIRWERDARKMTKGPKFDEIRPLLELVDNRRDELPDHWL